MSNLYDTSVFVEYFRGKKVVADYLQKAKLACSIVTAAELVQGARDKKAQLVIEKFLRRVTVFSLTPTISEHMLGLIGRFHLSHGLAIPDALIAATAIEHNLTLVTHNVKHFSFISGLSVHAWSEFA